MQGLVVGDLRIEAREGPAVQSLWKGKRDHRHPGEALAPLRELRVA